MALQVWGLLPKSQTSNETIEEAIARLIAEHESDEEAHLGVGDSLQSHKASEIIDHLARSIVTDKISANQLVFETCFENSSIFTLAGTPSFSFPGFSLTAAANGWANRESVMAECEPTGLNIDYTKDFISQFSFFADIGSPGHFKFMLCGGSDLDEEAGVGLAINYNTAYFFFAKTDGTSKTTLSWSTFDQLELYVVRFEYLAADQKVYFYVNNALIGSLSTPTGASDYPLYAIFAHWRDDVNAGAVTVSKLMLQLSP
jgi:hypothetical protein